MLSRPTTEQILLDCCRELMTNVLPSLTDATAQVSVIMVETVLRNTAVRAAHEVAWMREETAVAGGLAVLVSRGEEILDVRSGHETEVMAGWSPTGR